MSNTTFDSLTHKMERAAAGKLIDVALSHVHKDRQKAMVQMVDFAKQFYGDSFSEETYDRARLVLGNPDSKWSKLINCVLCFSCLSLSFEKRNSIMKHVIACMRVLCPISDETVK